LPRPRISQPPQGDLYSWLLLARPPLPARRPYAVQNRDYWSAKIARNKQRDEAAQISLKEHGWQVLVIWECELKDARAAMRMARRFLGSARAID
jgi:G:T-mismatch repair DNA endonuclease (very short patch repair protein)